jgi:hypothetical protein
MAKIPTPQSGQPLDVQYIAQLASAINDVAKQISPSNYKFFTIHTPARGRESIKNMETRMVAAHVVIASEKPVISGEEIPFSYEFDTDFSYPPIVTATIFNSGSSVGNAASVVIKTVTTSKVDGVVKFATNGNVSVGVNMIAVGIPANG